MKRYKVTVTRKVRQDMDVVLYADNEQEAIERATFHADNAKEPCWRDWWDKELKVHDDKIESYDGTEALCAGTIILNKINS